MKVLVVEDMPQGASAQQAGEGFHACLSEELGLSGSNAIEKRAPWPNLASQKSFCV